MKIEFINDSGETLAARLEAPTGKPKAYALFAHCFTCSKDIAAASRISRALTTYGIAVLRFDFTGLGNSEGDFSNTNFSSNIRDLLAAAEYMKSHHGPVDLLIGHSLGGAAVLSAATQIAEVQAVATIGAPSDPHHVAHLFQSSQEEIQKNGQASVQLAGRQFTIKKQFLDDLANQNVLEQISHLRKPLMIFHSPTDETVSIDEAAKIYLAAKHPKSFISLDGADHLLNHSIDSEYVAATLATWASRTLCAMRKPTEHPGTAEGDVLVEEKDGKFAQTVLAGKHVLAADEPPAVGGANTGPTPYDFLLAGLGSCTNMTIRMVARHKKIPLTHVQTQLSHSKIHARDCEDCEAADGKIDLIERKIQLQGDLTTEQRNELLKIADRCPVHRTLHSEVLVKTSFS